MKDNKLIHRFNEDICKIQDGQPISTDDISSDYVQTLKVAEALSAFSSVSLSQTQNDLKQHLLEKIGSKPQLVQKKPRLSFVYALGLCALLALFSLTIPPVRAFAQELVQMIGNFVFINEPTDAEKYVASMQSGTPTSSPDPLMAGNTNSQVFESALLSAEEASAKAGFTVYVIGDMPESYTLDTRDVLFTGQTITADTSFRAELDPPLQDGLQSDAIIALEQTQTNENTDPWITGTGDIAVVEVNLRGVKGVWIEQIPIYPFQNEQGEWEYSRWNQLIWSENDFTFVLQTNVPTDLLSLADMLKIAESITQ